MKHTPAPWTLNENETAPCELIGNGTIHIADIYATDFPAGKADSLLIAAAPEMLSALKLAGSALDLWLNGPGDTDGTETDRALLAVNKAIRKAVQS